MMTNENVPSQQALELMLNRQRMFQHDLGYEFSEMTISERVEYAKDMVLALTDELHEYLAEMSWKPWAQGDRFDEDAAMKELVDAWHFLMNLLIVTRPDRPPFSLAFELETRYLQKLETNRQRQRTGYDGVSTKCPHCGRALEDVELIQPLDGFVRGDGYLCGACQGSLDKEQLVAAGLISAR